MKIIVQNNSSNLKLGSRIDWLLILFTIILIFTTFFLIRKGSLFSFEEEANRLFLIVWHTIYFTLFSFCILRLIWNFFGTVEITVNKESEQLLIKKKLFFFRISSKYIIEKIRDLRLKQDKSSYISLENLTGKKIFKWGSDYVISFIYNSDEILVAKGLRHRDAEKLIKMMRSI